MSQLTNLSDQPPSPADDQPAPDTGQTIQPGRQPTFEITSDADGYHWTLYSGNGRPLAMNCIPYKRPNDAQSALKAMLDATKTGYRILIDNSKAEPKGK